MNLSFRLLNESDLPILCNWLQLPHVKEWWNDGDDTIEKVRDHYFKSIEGVSRYILSSNTKAIGYFQSYRMTENSFGIDQFIGDVEYINSGIGSSAVKQFVEYLVKEKNPSSITLDPEPSIYRGIRCYEKVGFKFKEVINCNDGTQAYSRGGVLKA